MEIYILAAIPVVFPFLVALAVHLYNVLLSHLPKAVQPMVQNVAHTAVLAAEQSGFDSPTKKHLASDSAHQILASLGLNVDPVYVDTAIEAAVLALHNPAIVIPPVVVPPVEIVSSPVVEVVKAPVVPTPIATVE